MISSTTARVAPILDRPLLSTHLATAHIDAMAAGVAPPRALVTGPAGSGKSRLLRHLRRAMTEAGRTVVTATRPSEVRSRPATDVVIVDDAHMIDRAMLEAIADRIADEDAAIVLACRPWPRSAELESVLNALERAQPAIVLGQVTHADLRAQDTASARLSDSCVDSILALTDGTAWLVAESLEIHASIDCAGGSSHSAIGDALRDVIVHRLRSVSREVRELVEAVSASPDGAAPASATEALFDAAYAEGLLGRNGRPAPAVRDSVRATMPVERLIGLYAATAGDVALTDQPLERALGGIRDTRLASAFLDHGDAVLQADPRRAASLFRAADEAGGDSVTATIRRAHAVWSAGDVDAASTLLDATPIDAAHPEYARAVDISAAVWSARGLASMSDQVYRSLDSPAAESSAHAAMAALAVGDRERVLDLTTQSPGRTMPSTLTVSLDLLVRGIGASVSGSSGTALTELVRAAEMYSASGAAGPLPEAPAVIAALAAVHVGEIDVAHSVLDAAVRDGHAGPWAHDRLLLWRAWVALQQEQAADVDGTVQEVLPNARSLSPRDRLLFDAITVAIARRYHDAPALTAAWRGARESLLRARFDLFSLLPLGEFVLAGARLGDQDRMRPHFTDALRTMDGFGTPPLWSAHLHWTGIQQGILLGRPGDLAPHARALIDAAPHNPLAAKMAQAGRVWTTVLAGSVDADLVESAALGLAAVGLAWDGARLAGHAAARSDDRRVSARLLACARRLHPRHDVRTPSVEEDAAPPTALPRPRAHDELSPREREVAALVIEGKTYAEIGSAIFISPRTAEHHIARIRRRLGATTRSDLIAKLRVALDDDAHVDADSGDAKASA